MQCTKFPRIASYTGRNKDTYREKNGRYRRGESNAVHQNATATLACKIVSPRARQSLCTNTEHNGTVNSPHFVVTFSIIVYFGADNSNPANRNRIMDPHSKFEGSVKFVRRLFQIVGQDIFQSNFQRSKMFYVILTGCLVLLSFIAISSVDHVGAHRWLEVALFFASSQVVYI